MQTRHRRQEIRGEMLLAHPWCHWCGERLYHWNATLDHHVPRALGGTNDRRNLRLCCPDCNHAKGHMTATEFWRALCRGDATLGSMLLVRTSMVRRWERTSPPTAPEVWRGKLLGDVSLGMVV